MPGTVIELGEFIDQIPLPLHSHTQSHTIVVSRLSLKNWESEKLRNTFHLHSLQNHQRPFERHVDGILEWDCSGVYNFALIALESLLSDSDFLSICHLPCKMGEGFR